MTGTFKYTDGASYGTPTGDIKFGPATTLATKVGTDIGVDAAKVPVIGKDSSGNLYYRLQTSSIELSLYKTDGTTRLTDSSGLLIDWSGVGNALYATGGNVGDVFYGGTGADSLYGGSGDDLLYGGTGNDFLDGGAGNDTLSGGDGNDLLTAGLYSADVDYVDGGNGDDWAALYPIAINGQADTLIGGAGTDVLFLSYQGGAATYDLSAATITGFEAINALNNTASIALPDAFTANGATTAVRATNLTGSNTFTFDGSAETDGKFAITGGEGNDTLIGGAGDDTVSGGNGSDALSGGTGNDLFDGGAGNDTLSGGTGDDTLSGGNGNDTLSGGTGSDTLSGGAGNDVFYATIAEIGASEAIDGGIGTDTLSLLGNGTLDLSTRTVSGVERLVVTADASFRLTLGDGFTASGATTTIDASAIVTATNALNVNFSAEADGAFAITGGAGNDLITSGAGNDTVSGGAGNDSVLGGSGTDALSGAAGEDTLSGGDGNDTLTGGTDNDVFIGTASELAGDTIADLAVGDSIVVTGSDLSALNGTSASASLSVGGGTLALTGISSGYNWQAAYGGADTTLTLVAAPAVGGGGGTTSTDSGTSTPTVDGVAVQQTVTNNGGGAPVQTVVVPTVTTSRVEQSGVPTAADIPVKTTSGQTILQLQVPTGVGLQVQGDAAPRGAHQSVGDLIRAIEARTTAGSTDQQTLTGSGAGFLQSLPQDANLLIQTVVPTASGVAPTQPIVIAGPGAAGVSNGVQVPVAMVIDASGLPSGTVIQLQNVDFAAVVGAVRVSGGEGSQQVTGDGADQWMVLGADDDTLHGGGGNDFVGSEGGDDVLYGDAGLDTVTGGIGNDILYGNQQGDVVYGNQGLDTLFGGQDADTLFGGQDSDVLYGNLGGDTLFGGQGDDALFGGQGNDVLAGNLGADTLTGGLGADVFRIGAPGEGVDVIADFTLGEDRIAVVGPNFGAIPAGNLSAGHFALDNPTTVGAMFVFNTRSGMLSFDADGSGAGAAVAIATLNVRTLSYTDILVTGSGT